MRVWLWPAGVALLALAGATAARAEGGPAPRRTAAPEAVDAEMLKDLDLLSSPDYARDREVARRMGFFERLRMLEAEPGQGGANAPPAPTGAVHPAGPVPPPPPPPKDTK
ncbi:MAG TPA: hypothetical protein VJX92_02815 [Methylomirabilota bacterium]|nr:hypothetical protein [Methylomirabilota bacterium]